MRYDLTGFGRMGATLAGVMLAAAAFAVPARADVVGQLQCNISGNQGAVLTSTRAVACTFLGNGTPPQLYNGTLSRVGLDIGTLNSGVLTYQVVAIGVPVPGALQGNYIGSGVGLTIGRGIGVDALVGGSGNTITLQPLATSVNTGNNLNAGLGALRLQFAGLAEPPMMMHRRHHRFHHRHMG